MEGDVIKNSELASARLDAMGKTVIYIVHASRTDLVVHRDVIVTGGSREDATESLASAFVYPALKETLVPKHARPEPTADSANKNVDVLRGLLVTLKRVDAPESARPVVVATDVPVNAQPDFLDKTVASDVLVARMGLDVTPAAGYAFVNQVTMVKNVTNFVSLVHMVASA